MPRYCSCLLRASMLLAGVVPATAGCGGSGDQPGPGGGTPGAYQTCSAETRTGHFAVELTDTYTGVTGSVLDGVEPESVPMETMKLGECRLMKPPLIPPCSPGCAPGTQTCSPRGCIAKPQTRNVGRVTVTGLSVPLTLTSIDNLYANPPGSPPHPGYQEGASIGLQASGGDMGYGPFSLDGFGVALMKAPSAPLLVEDRMPVTITWTPPTKPGPTRVLVSFAINWHGAVDTWLDCDVPDSGSFTLPAATVSELFKHGVSGYPRADIQRTSADTTMLTSGCVQLSVLSKVSRNLMIPGLVSCQSPDDCPSKKCEFLRCVP